MKYDDKIRELEDNIAKGITHNCSIKGLLKTLKLELDNFLVNRITLKKKIDDLTTIGSLMLRAQHLYIVLVKCNFIKDEHSK